MLRLESRVNKLERGLRRPGADYYVVWGRDAEEVEAKVSAARDLGILNSGDRFLAAVWSGNDEMPAPRWAGLRDLSDVELQIAIGRVTAAIRHSLAADKDPPPGIESMPDAELVAIALERTVP